MKGRCRIKTVIALVAALLCVCVASVTAKTAYAAADDTQTETLSLHRKNPEENMPFQMKDMFPGDSVTREYRVQVSYTGTVTVCIQAEPAEGDEELAEVLEMKVRLLDPDTNEVLAELDEESIAGMPKLEHELTTDSEAQTDELCYEVTVSLRTEAGNEYQNKSLTVDLVWWAKGSDDETPDSTETEDGTQDSAGDGTQGSTEDGTGESAGGGGNSGGGLVDPPDTGDHSRMLMWLMRAGAALAVMLAAGLVLYRTGGLKKLKGKKRWLGVLPVILLTLAFGTTSLALLSEVKVKVGEILFTTGEVSICLNDNKPVFDEAILFEPGMTVEKDFTLENDGGCDVYFRLYFSNIRIDKDADFADALTVEVSDGENVIFKGSLSEMEGVKSDGAQNQLAKGETRTLTITFHVPETAGNKMQGGRLLFDLNAEAVQAVNNPDGAFE